MSSGRAARRRKARAAEPASFWRGRGPLVGSLAVVAVVIAVFIWLGRGSDTAPTASPAETSAVVAAMTSIPAATYDAVGAGGVPQPLKRGGDLVKGASGKPLVIYVGGDFCPYCAAERWAIVAALSRFGTFNGLQLGRSSSSDVFPNTATFSFKGSSYASQFIEFAPVETADRQGKPQDQPTPAQQASMSRFNPQGSIPYLSLGDRYVAVGSGVAPDLFAGKTWTDLAAQATDAKTPIGRAVLGNANYITAAICDLTGQQPASVCSSTAIRALAPPQ